MDMHPIDSILERYDLTPVQWHQLQKWPRFKALLQDAVTSWQGALNTHERTKLKAAAMMEEFLPELNTRMHDSNENLPAKIEGAKLVARIAQMGVSEAGIIGAGGEKVSITINLGQDVGDKIKFEKSKPIIDVTPEVK